jgi:hypothetical protein
MHDSGRDDDLMDRAVTVSPKITAADIKLGIRSSRAAGYQTFFEVGNDTGARVSRHADVVSVGIWPSTGHQVHGFEVKVSRTDFLNEMKNPAKSQAIFRFCHRWSLATTPGLVKVDELPPNWGLVTWDGRVLRTVKQAPLLTPEPISPGFVAALVRRAGEADATLITAAVEKAKREWREQADKLHDKELERRKQGNSGEARRAIAIVTKLQADLEVDYIHVFEVPEIIAALKIVRKMRLAGSGWGTIEHLSDELMEVRKKTFEIVDRIAKVMDDAGIEHKQVRP